MTPRSEMIWNQFGASIDMLENAVRACPADVWGDRADFQEFWYMAYHTLFWLDFYLDLDRENFAPPEPFGLEEFDPAGAFPAVIYTPDQLLGYLSHCRKKLRRILRDLDDASAEQIIPHPKRSMSREEWLWYNMRHVQHHAAQLNLLLRQRAGDAPRWVAQTAHPLLAASDGI
jgi:hypothetical protein